jgi:hypothetical protein
MAMGDGSRVVPSWTVPLLGLIAVGLIGWTLFLTYVLPAHHVSDEWRLAWAGFDLALAAAIGATAFGIVQGAFWLEAAAATTTTLLCTDAWFDIVLSGPGRERFDAIILAAFAELPLAGFCFWIALNAERALKTFKASA